MMGKVDAEFTRMEIARRVIEYRKTMGHSKVFRPGFSYIKPSSPLIEDDDYQLMTYALLDGWFTEGRMCQAFSERLCEEVGKQYCVLTNSGSSATLLALAAVKKHWPHVKRMYTGAMGFPTTVSALFNLGFYPHYVDLAGFTDFDYDLESFNSKTAFMGAILTHNLGFPFNELRLRNLIGDGEPLISDACDALGSRYLSGDHVGSCSDMVTLSFFPAHQITTGEGGAVLTDDRDIYNTLRSLANWGRDCHCTPGQDNMCGMRFNHPEALTLPLGYDHKYVFTNLGFNFKMTEFQGALGLTQINKLESFVALRQKNYQYLYDRIFPNGDGIVGIELDGDISPFGFPIGVLPSATFTALDMISYLEKHKVGTRRMFGGNVSKQPAFYNRKHGNTDFVNTDHVAANMFWVGCYPALTQEKLEYIGDVIDNFLNAEMRKHE